MLCCLNTQAQNAFPYPALPDTLRSVEQRATYLSEHYWDNYQLLILPAEKRGDYRTGIRQLHRYPRPFQRRDRPERHQRLLRQGLRTEACQGEIREPDRALFRRPTVADEKRQGI